MTGLLARKNQRALRRELMEWLFLNIKKVEVYAWFSVTESNYPTAFSSIQNIKLKLEAQLSSDELIRIKGPWSRICYQIPSLASAGTRIKFTLHSNFPNIAGVLPQDK